MLPLLLLLLLPRQGKARPAGNDCKQHSIE
jgi:hypothetical protein